MTGPEPRTLREDLAALWIAVGAIGSHAAPCPVPDGPCACGVASARKDAGRMLDAVLAAHPAAAEPTGQGLETVIAGVLELSICHPDQCCRDGYCIEAIGLHAVDKDTAQYVAETIADHLPPDLAAAVRAHLEGQ